MTSSWWHYVAFFVLGIGSWTLVSAVFAEASFFAAHLPEGKAIFAQLDLAVQCANAVPALLVVLLPGLLDQRLVGVTGVLFVLSLGCALLLAFGWHDSSTLLAASFVAGVVGTTSMVTFFPLVAPFGVVSVSALSCGVGLCGLVTLLLAVAQGMADTRQLRFSVGTYFGILLVLQVAAGAGFAAVVMWRKRHLRQAGQQQQQLARLIEEGGDGGGGGGGRAADDGEASSGSAASSSTIPVRRRPWLRQCAPSPSLGSSAKASGAYYWCDRDTLSSPLVRRAVYPCTMIAWTCVLQYAVPGLLPYLADQASKDDPSSVTFMLTFAFFLGSALGRFGVALYRPKRLALLNLAQTALCIYAVVVASLVQHGHHDPHPSQPSAPRPPPAAAPTSPGNNNSSSSNDNNNNGTVTASVPKPPYWISIVLMCAFSFLHGATVTLVFGSVSDSPVLTRWCGLANQAGAGLGSLVTFLLVTLGVLGK